MRILSALRSKPLIGLIFLTFLGAIIRIHNLSPFTFYPDSYQSLIVAENLRNFHSVVGTLGSDGFVYPPFFIWTRPVYPLLINLVSLITHNPLLSAKFIAVSSGILAIPLVYVLLNRIFRSDRYGLAGAFLLAFSYQHALWSGFIMTESLGVFFMLLFLLSLFSSVRKSVLTDPYDFLTGILLTLAVFTRYEYLLILIPVIFLVLRNEKHPLPRLLNIGTAFFLSGVALLSFLFPLRSLIDIIIAQLADLLMRGVLILLVLCIGFAIFTFRQTPLTKRLQKIWIVLSALFFFSLPFILQTPLTNLMISQLIITSIPFVPKFIRTDFLLSLLSSIGCIMLFRRKDTRTLMTFVSIAVLVLLLIYQQINQDMERYLTHLIPFLLIPAAYALATMFHLAKQQQSLLGKVAVPLFVSLFFWQSFITYQGLRQPGDNSWYEPSYEEIAAAKVAPFAQNPEILLLASLPEPYFLTTHHTTQSLADEYPYIFLPSTLNKREVLIIQDMGMHELFPHFSAILQDKFQDKKIAVLTVNAPYRYGNRTEPARYPIVLYKTTLKDLKNRLQ